MYYTNEKMDKHEKMRYTYVGLDLHKQTHTAVFMDCFYDVLGEVTFSSIPSAFPTFLKQAKKYLITGTTFMWGLEDVAQYGRTLAKFLTTKGEVVKHVNAGLVARERDAFNMPHKTDSFDALCAARILLSRLHDLPTAVPDDKYFVLKTLTARHEANVKMRIALKNQLHGMLMDPYPSYQVIFPTITSKASLAFFHQFPTPERLTHINEEELTSFLRAHSKNRLGEAKAKQILDATRREKTEITPYDEARHFVTKSIIRQLRASLVEINDTQYEIKQFLRHFEAPLTTLKGIDVITAAQFLVEIGPIERFKNAAALAKYAGVSPRTKSSGKTETQYANRSGNRKLNKLFFRLSVHQALPMGKHKTLINPLFADYFKKKMSEGKTKRQSLKAVQRRLINIVYRMIKDGEDYLPTPNG